MLDSLTRRAGEMRPAARAVLSPDPAISRQLYGLAVPSLVENLLQTTLSVVDLMMIGRLGAEAIAAVGLGNQILMLLMVMYTGLAVGNTALVARFIGARDNRDAERAARQALIMGAGVSVVVALIGFFFSYDIIRLMGGTPEVSRLGGQFLRIVSTTSVVMMIMLIGNGTLRGAGDTRTPMLITGFINLVNVVVSYGLIFGKFGLPALGVAGSALGMTLARTVGSVLVLWVLFFRSKLIHLDIRRGWRIDLAMIRRLANIGVPAAGESTVFTLGLVLFSMITISLGTADLAAQQIAFNIAGFSFMPAFAFGVAATTLVGQSLGARDPHRAEASAIQAWKSGILWMSLMGVGFVIFRHWLIGAYTTDPEVIRLGSVLLLYVAVGQPLQATSIVLGGALRGAGDTRSIMLITVAGMWVMRLGVGYFIGIVLGLGLFGVWIGWIADFVTRALLITRRYRSGRWEEIEV